jgi:hypothetical protein
MRDMPTTKRFILIIPAVCSFVLLIAALFLGAATALAFENQEPAARDCSEWKSRATTFEVAGITLGAALGEVRYDLKRLNETPARYADGLEVKTYLVRDKLSPVAIIETIRCNEGGELVVGIREGGNVYGPFPTVDQWIAKQTLDLQQAGVGRIQRGLSDNKLFLWGVKGRMDPENGLTDYQLLRRNCIQVKEATRLVCGLSHWEVGHVRSRGEMR